MSFVHYLPRILCCGIIFFFIALPVRAEGITLNIKNGDVRDVLNAVASLSGVSIAADASVSGRVSLNFSNVPLTTALDIITSSQGLAYRRLDKVIIVASQANIAKYGGRIVPFKLSYASAGEVKEALTPLLDSNNKIAADPVSNTILFSGSGSDEQKLRSAIQILDVPTKQITLEAKIISVNAENGRQLGVNWAWDSIPQRVDNYNSDTDEGDGDNENYDGNFKFWRGYSFRFNAVLNAMLTEGKAKILATPSIITIPGREASIFIGDHIPVQTEKHDSSGNYTATEYIDAGIKLTYTPVISADGDMVTAAVHTEVSTPSLVSEIKNYKVTSRTADTNVRMRSGETLIIGGLINEDEQRTLQKIPFLSSIPLLGELFKNRTASKTKTEVIMLLTPHITDAGVSPAIYDPALLEKAAGTTSKTNAKQ